MSDTTDETDSRLLDGFWQVIAAHGWHGVTLRRLAAASGLKAATIAAQCPGGPRDLLALHGRAVDAAVTGGTVPGQGGTPRDRIFDVLMRRIDAMQPHRAGLVRLLEELRTEPALALCLLASLPRSMAGLLRAAEVDPTGIHGALRVQGVTAVWLATIRAWIQDDLGRSRPHHGGAGPGA
ncbi:TetR family transcriptional regulator [Dankookia sp. P2]|uniref:TetR family transcriptional regulator n=1 Tax=Dankookia sp. P2 TaxID=3423955 RepID=UPI003D663F14